jgi:hypothetical protein
MGIIVQSLHKPEKRMFKIEIYVDDKDLNKMLKVLTGSPLVTTYVEDTKPSGKSPAPIVKTSIRELMLQRLVEDGHPVTLKQLIEIANGRGGSKSAASGGVDFMLKKKWVKRVGPAVYEATPLGVKAFETTRKVD